MPKDLRKSLWKELGILFAVTPLLIPFTVFTSSLSWLQAIYTCCFCFFVVLFLTVWKYRKSSRLCVDLFEPLLASCKLMMSEFEVSLHQCPEIEKHKQPESDKRECYVVLKEIIYKDLLAAYQKLLRGKHPFRWIGISSTSTALEFFDEQSDFVQKILALDKALNPKPKKEKRK